MIEIPAYLGHADDRQIETFVANQFLQRWQDLLVREIAPKNTKAPDWKSAIRPPQACRQRLKARPVWVRWQVGR
ncbi:MAG: hypothetical protein WBV26_01415, partial [Candidatus Sulfotelmatobacter sp.]